MKPEELAVEAFHVKTHPFTLATMQSLMDDLIFAGAPPHVVEHIWQKLQAAVTVAAMVSICREKGLDVEKFNVYEMDEVEKERIAAKIGEMTPEGIVRIHTTSIPVDGEG